jgi:hypothetical protein
MTGNRKVIQIGLVEYDTGIEQLWIKGFSYGGYMVIADNWHDTYNNPRNATRPQICIHSLDLPR